MVEITPNPRKTTSVRRLGTVDVTALQEAVGALPEASWNAENAGKPNRFDALDATQHIVFRFVRDFNDWRDSYDGPLWTEWKSILTPVMTDATKPYGYARGEFPRVMLARMAPQGVIYPHRDLNPAAKWPHKIHVPLVTNEHVDFHVGDQQYHFAVGEAVEVNNMGLHAVRNGGSTDRIHLIFEYYDADQETPEWLSELKDATD